MNRHAADWVGGQARNVTLGSTGGWGEGKAKPQRDGRRFFRFLCVNAVLFRSCAQHSLNRWTLGLF